jgi:hypothetical protein
LYSLIQIRKAVDDSALYSMGFKILIEYNDSFIEKYSYNKI